MQIKVTNLQIKSNKFAAKSNKFADCGNKKENVCYFWFEINFCMKNIAIQTTNRQPNIITMRRDNYTLLATQLFYLVIKELKQDFAIQSDIFKNLTFNVSTRLLKSPHPKNIEEACDSLQSLKIKIKSIKDNGFIGILPFPYCEYLHGKRMIKVELHKEAVKYFCELSQGFTEYKLLAALSLKKTYSQRMYELLSRWKDTGIWKVAVDELKELVGVSGKTYNYATFKKRVIIAAQDEINESTDIYFTFKEHKTGRSFTHITFNIKHEKPVKDIPAEIPQVDESIKKDPDYMRIKGLLADRYAITSEKYINQIVKNKKAFWKLNNEYLKNKDNVVKPIKNPAGFILTGLGLK